MREACIQNPYEKRKFQVFHSIYVDHDLGKNFVKNKSTLIIMNSQNEIWGER